MTCWSNWVAVASTPPQPKLPRLSNPIQRGSQHPAIPATHGSLSACMPARPLTARGPPSTTSVQPVPARTVWPEQAHSENSGREQGARAVGPLLVSPIDLARRPCANQINGQRMMIHAPPKDPQETQDARALATSRPHCNIERLESLRFFGTCGAHPGSVAQVLVAKGREVRTSCPRRRWRMEVPLVSDQRECSYRDLHSEHSIRGYEDSMGPDKTSEPRREGPDG
ncbi:hypothetical protein Trihar35433_9572 [Trichoderma harzianum]|nr:hypothetical protein Trihar35433_9572 [Trichoderma harzianum]